MSRFYDVITFVRISKIMLRFLSQVILKFVNVSFNPYQPNDEFHTQKLAILFALQIVCLQTLFIKGHLRQKILFVYA